MRSRVAVGVVLFDDHDRVVMVRRRREPLAGHWSLPGGKVEPGEGLEEAARREALEETGLRIEVERLICVVHLAHGEGTYKIHEFRCALARGESWSNVRAGDDAAEVRLCSQAEVTELGATDEVVRVIEDARRIRA